MSIFEGTREPITLDKLFDEINKLGTSTSMRLVDAIEEHTDFHLDPFDGYLRSNNPPYTGAIPIDEVSRKFGFDTDKDGIFMYVYILEEHIVFVTTNRDHDCVGKAAAVPLYSVYQLVTLLEKLGINVSNINEFMNQLIMTGKDAVVYVRQFTQRRTKFYEEGMKGVSVMLDKKTVGSLAACVRELNCEMRAIKEDPYYDDVKLVSNTVLEYTANKETGHPIYFRVEYVKLKVTGYPRVAY